MSVKQRKGLSKNFILPLFPLARVEKRLGITEWLTSITERIEGSETEWQSGVYFHPRSCPVPTHPGVRAASWGGVSLSGQTPSPGAVALWQPLRSSSYLPRPGFNSTKSNSFGKELFASRSRLVSLPSSHLSRPSSCHRYNRYPRRSFSKTKSKSIQNKAHQ